MRPRMCLHAPGCIAFSMTPEEAFCAVHRRGDAQFDRSVDRETYNLAMLEPKKFPPTPWDDSPHWAEKYS